MIVLNMFDFCFFTEISKLNLRKLDFANNRIEKIPTVFRKIDTLQEIILENNPLSIPPAHVSITVFLLENGAMGRRIDPSWGGARCSSVVIAFTHGAMGRWIDPSCWTH